MNAARGATTASRWLAPAGLAIAGAAVAGVMLRPAGERGLVEGGVAYAVVTYDLVLALVGLDFALATMTRWQAILFAVVLVGSIPLGVSRRASVPRVGGVAAGSSRLFIYLGPLCCAVAGLTLSASAGGLRLCLMPASAALSGAALGFLAALHDPTIGDPRFACGVAAVGLWLHCDFAGDPALVRHDVADDRRPHPRQLAGRHRPAAGRLAACGAATRRGAQRADAIVHATAGLDRSWQSEGPAATTRPRDWGDTSRQP